MSFQTDTNIVEKSTTPHSTVILLYIVYLVVVFGYTVINRLVPSIHLTQSPIDGYIPFISVFVIPYLIYLPILIIVPLFLIRSYKIFKHFIIVSVIANLSAYLVYWLFPTYVIRHTIQSANVFDSLVQFVYNNDMPVNALPSGHTYMSCLIWFALSTLAPKYRFIYPFVFLPIILSTVFIKQHFLPDVIVGVLWAIGAWLLATYILKVLSKKSQ